MADDAGKSRFKSKWGRVFKENDSPTNSGNRANTFKLNDDVADFLKPSIEASKEKQASTKAHLAPKLDIALAKRWPEAQDVRRVAEASPHMRAEDVPMYYTKPRRRPGLMVGFAKTAPEVIGEGGDEALDPVGEISRQKAAIPRSVSDRRPAALPARSQWPLGDEKPTPRPQQQQQQLPTRAPVGSADDGFRAPPMRRAQTSHNELSAPLERKHMSPPLHPPSPPKPTFLRTPTGFSSQDTESPISPISPISPESDQNAPPMPIARPRPSVETAPPASKTNPRYDSAVSTTSLSINSGGGASLSPGPISPNMRKQRDMGAREGMTLRRAGALCMDGDEDGTLKDPNSGFEPSPDYYNALVDITSTTSSPPASKISPVDTLLSPGGLSPFADPNYIKRHSGEVPVASAPRLNSPEPQPQGSPPAGRQPHPTYEPSYIRTQPPPAMQPPQRPPPQTSREIAMRPAREDPRPDPRQSDPRALSSQAQDPVPLNARRLPSEDRSGYMRAIQPPSGDMVPTSAAPMPSQNMTVPSQENRNRPRSLGGVRKLNSQGPLGEVATGPRQMPSAGYTNNNNTAQIPPPMSVNSRNSPREEVSSRTAGGSSTGRQAPSSPNHQQYSRSFHNGSPHSSVLGPGRPHVAAAPPEAKPSMGYSALPRIKPGQPLRSPATSSRQEETARPGSAGLDPAVHRPAPDHNDEAASAALKDFAGRVAHMRGVFRLTAEKERLGDQCTPQTWLRAALWWFLVGKAGLEALFRQRPKSIDGYRELLTQPHVDLAKAWWILSDALESFDTGDDTNLQSASPDAEMRNAATMLRTHLQSLALSMTKSSLMPPHQSLIQGQDTKIWLNYPRFTSDAASALNGHAGNSLVAEPQLIVTMLPIDALPLGDSKDTFCYGRFPVDVFLSTDDAETDRVVLPCVFSVVRSKRDFQTSIIIASQHELVNVKVLPRATEGKGLAWRDVDWKSSTSTLIVHLPRGFDLSVRMQEFDFRTVWNLVEYSRKVERTLHAAQDEKLIHDSHLAELQYADSSNSTSFPQDKVRGCMALVFERKIPQTDGSGVRLMHRGFRLLFATEPGHKSLSVASHEICKEGPLYFEFLTDAAAANGTTAMVIRVREATRQCRILLVFRDTASRQGLYDVLNGLTVGPHETIVTRATLTALNIQPAAQVTSFSPTSHPALQSFQWQKLGVTNQLSDDPNDVVPETVHSESLRIVARHATGCITDRLNLSKGDLLFRLPCAGVPAIQILRYPQEDLTMSIDTRFSAPQVVDGIAELMQTARQQTTIRTFTFALATDLHAFQTAITGWTVLFDAVASTFGISRRMMVVPIYHKWTASSVRIQVVTRDSVTKVLAFMDDFTHAEAMVIQVKTTDVFEGIKGDSKGTKKWAVKMVDAKFSLPGKDESGKKEKEKEQSLESVEELVKRRLVNLEGLDYAEDHDDITIGWETEEARDKFAKALPAATTVGRMITLKRRI